VRIAYHAHDPFDYYSYSEGYTRGHEDLLVPLCDHVFTISDALSADFKIRYPQADITTLGNAVDQSFLAESSSNGLSSAAFRAFRVGDGPLVGIVGQINSSYDWDLLEQVAERNPQTQLVFIGGLFEEGAITERIRSIFGRPNVHWLGPKPHQELKQYMEACDILLNPLIANAQNDRRDTLRLYDYLSTRLPVVSTPIASVRQHGALVYVPGSHEEMMRVLGVRPKPVSSDALHQRRTYLAQNTWAERARQMLHIIMPESV
jgi:glycosyltransferase involved in cell wall biosynthesis